MPGKLADQIKQSKPFGSLEEETFLNLIRTTEFVRQSGAAMLASYDLSHEQYNVLRILRGAGADGRACGEIAARMVTRDPDITRLLDRLEKRGFVKRTRESEDRRVITVRITPAGEALAAALDEPMLELGRRLLGHLGPDKLRTLIGLLEEARESPA